MFTLIAYDVASDKRRLKLARLLRSYGERVQRSVFECHLSDRELAALLTAVARVIDEAEDSVRLYRVAAAPERVIVLGAGQLTDDPDSYLF